jgi:hypothetical protein
MSNDNRKFVSGSVSFGNREDKDNYELIGLLRDYQYLLKHNKPKLNSGDRELFTFINKKFKSVLRRKMKFEKQV